MFSDKTKLGQSKAVGLIFAAFAVIVWGITFICTKTLLKSFSPLEILFIRFVLAYVVLWVIHPKWINIKFKDNLFFACAGLTGVVLYQFFENIAISYTTASNVSVIVSVCPLFTAILCQIFLKEKKIDLFFIIGFIVSIVGITLVSLNGSNLLELNPKGDLLALLSALCWGFYSLFVTIINSKNYDGICSTRRIFFFAIIFMIPLMLIGIKSPDSRAMAVNISQTVNLERFSNLPNWLNLCFLGIFASGLCFAAWNRASLILGTVKAAVGIYMIPVVTIICAFFYLDERISVSGGIGAALTIIGLFVSSVSSRRKKLS
ncbi:MAG: DMT family transporter [Treponema sp.]|nr:DMT family transporter [Treponema sp.]